MKENRKKAISEQLRGEIKSVTFDYENVTQTLTGEDLKRWIEAIDGICIFMANRNMNPFDIEEFDWKKTWK